MKHSIADLRSCLGDLILASVDDATEFTDIASAQDYAVGDLVFVSSAEYLPSSGSDLPAVLVTDKDLAAQLPRDYSGTVIVSDVRLAQARAKQHFCDYDASDSEWSLRHESAVIHPSAEIADDVRVGPNTTIGAHVKIGSGTQIRANCVIEHGAVIGQSCLINNLVNIGYDCVIGDRVIVRPGVIIGNEGFGFAQDKQSRYHRLPHTGIVEIADDVQIGANCNIDRGTYGKTVIARGVKLDALCHIAHNCVIEEDVLMVAQSGIAGSCYIGKRAILSGQTGMIDHRTVAADAVLVHRCGVTEDIPSSGVWAGTPPKPFREYVRNVNAGKKLAKLEKRVAELSKKLRNS